MPSDSNLDKIPVSPIDDDDLWLINREDKSYKVTSKMLGGYLITSPVPEICDPDDPDDCPPGKECVDGYCERIPCDSEQPPGQEGCPPDHVCIGDYCYPKCDIGGVPCGEGYVCVDPGITGGDAVCLPYPFPCRPDLIPGDGCPPGYVCWGGNCYQTCLNSGGPPGVGQGSQCPPGMECVEFSDPDSGVGYICVPSAGGFPCVDGQCPAGYDCFFGMCFAKCGDPSYPNSGVCDEGFQCLNIEGIDYCVPYPFPCDLYGPGCPDGMTCYNGDCYPDCDPSGTPCEDGFECTDIGGGDFICYPEIPTEGFVNDGPLVIRTEPVDYPSTPATEKIVFTANQFGRSVLTFQGFDQNSGGPGGGICSIDGDCPPGFSCVSGVCVYIPCTGNADCDHPDWPMVCENGFCFPSCMGTDENCPSGYECVDGICLPGGVHPIGECGPNGKCPSGYQCIDGYCVPKPCGSGCGPDEYCYNGYCYSKCNNITGCGPNHICVEVVPPTLPDGSDAISICMPIGGGPDGGGSGGDININIDPDWWNPENGLSPINDGKLVIRTEPYDYPSHPATENLAFTANQLELSVLTFEGFDQSGGNGGDININVDPDWWDPANGVSPINDGILSVEGVNQSGNKETQELFTANQKPNTTLKVEGLILNPDIGGGINAEIDFEKAIPAGTKLIFPQKNAPTYWTRVTGLNQHALRIVDNGTTGGQTFGSVNFTSAFSNQSVGLKKHKHTTSASGNTNSTGSHTHNFTVNIRGAFSAKSTDEASYTPSRSLDSELGEFLEDAHALLVDNDLIDGTVYFHLREEALNARSTEGFVAVINALVDLTDGVITQSEFDTIVNTEVLRVESINYKELNFGLEDIDCEGVSCPSNMGCVNGICLCLDGYVYDSSTQSCIEDPQSGFSVSTCPSNSHFNGQSCECDDEYVLDGQGNCVFYGEYPVEQCTPAYVALKIRDQQNWPANGCSGSRVVYMSTNCTDNIDSNEFTCTQNGTTLNFLAGTPGVVMSNNNRNANINCAQFPFKAENGVMTFTAKVYWGTSRSLSVGPGQVVGIGQCDPCVGVNCGANASCNNGSCVCDSGFTMVNGKCTPSVVHGTSDPSGTHKHTLSTTGNTNDQGVTDPKIDLRVKYLDSIVCQKDVYY